MRIARFRSLCARAGLVIPLALGAQPAPGVEVDCSAGLPAPPKHAVTLAEALAAADSAPEVVVARAEERVAEAGIGVAGAGSPLSVGLATHSITAHESLSISYPLRWGGTRGAALDAARASLEEAAQWRLSALASARHTVRVAWFSLAAKEQLARIAAERAERALRNRDAVSALLDQGRVPRLDQVRAGAEAALVRSDADAAGETLAAASGALASLLGTPAGETLATAGDLPSPEEEGPIRDWLARASSSSPEVLAQERRMRAAQARSALAHRQRLPGLAIEAGADFNDPTQPGTDAYAAMTVTVPLDGKAKSGLADFELGREAAELERVKRLAAASTETAWHSAVTARGRLRALETAALPSAREAAELSRLAYREGKLDLFRLLDTERTLAETEDARWEAFEAWGIAWADLLRSAGETA